MRIPQEGHLSILPPKEGACWFCGDIHESKDPHNASSLLYQHRFRKQHGRYPTWEDAMGHCDKKTKEKWAKKLEKKGITVTIQEEEQTEDGR